MSEVSEWTVWQRSRDIDYVAFFPPLQLILIPPQRVKH
jgi:hypothetical protein